MLIVNNDYILLGTIKFGEPCNFSYILENQYITDVFISAYAGCSSCTTINIKNPTLKSGEKTDINICFTPGSTGQQEKFIVVQSKTGNVGRPDMVLRFKANINE